jgi:hypothetical protein
MYDLRATVSSNREQSYLKAFSCEFRTTTVSPAQGNRALKRVFPLSRPYVSFHQLRSFGCVERGLQCAIRRPEQLQQSEQAYSITSLSSTIETSAAALQRHVREVAEWERFSA